MFRRSFRRSFRRTVRRTGEKTMPKGKLEDKSQGKSEYRSDKHQTRPRQLVTGGQFFLLQKTILQQSPSGGPKGNQQGHWSDLQQPFASIRPSEDIREVCPLTNYITLWTAMWSIVSVAEEPSTLRAELMKAREDQKQSSATRHWNNLIQLEQQLKMAISINLSSPGLCN